MKLNVKDFIFPSDMLYDDIVCINKKKVNDFMKTIKHFLDENTEPYNILSWKTMDVKEEGHYIGDRSEKSKIKSRCYFLHFL